jgi:hypothetical protein
MPLGFRMQGVYYDFNHLVRFRIPVFDRLLPSGILTCLLARQGVRLYRFENVVSLACATSPSPCGNFYSRVPPSPVKDTVRISQEGFWRILQLRFSTFPGPRRLLVYRLALQT